MTRTRRGAFFSILSLLSLPGRAVAQTSATPDPIEGKWYGTAGFPRDRVESGFEFKRNEKGELEGFVYRPVVNFYGVELPSPMKRDGAKYACREMAIALELRGEKLEGTVGSLGEPISLERVQSLPHETPLPDFPAGPGPRWRTKLGAAIYAPAAVWEDMAYVGTSGGAFYAVRLADGSFAWNVAAGRAIHGEALVTAEAVYFGCDDGWLRKLERKSGKELWRYDLGDARVGRMLPHFVHSVLPNLGVPNAGDFDFDTIGPKPLLADGVLYLGSGDGSFRAVEAETGEELWRFQTKGKIRSSAVLDGERVYFGSYDENVYALDRAEGTKVWASNMYGPSTSSAALIAGKLIVGNRNGLLEALEPASGKVAWGLTFWGSSVESDAVAGAGSLFYVGSSDLRRVSLIDAADGRVVWRTDVYGWAWPRVAVAEKTLYVSTGAFSPYFIRHLGALTALERESGKIRWRWPMPDWPGALIVGFAAGPALARDLVVVGGLDGTLYAFPRE